MIYSKQDFLGYMKIVLYTNSNGLMASNIWRQTPSGRITSENLAMNIIVKDFWEYVAQGGSLTQDLADSLTLSDIITSEVAKIASDSFTLSDIRTFDLSRLTEDLLSLSDTIAKDATRDITDSLTASDGFSTEASYVRSIADGVNLSDDLIKDFFGSLIDSITLSEDVSFEKAILKDIADTLTLSDDSSLREIGKGLTDVLTLSEELSNSVETLKSDSITLSDEEYKALGINLSDTIGSFDSITKDLSIAFIDYVTFYDSLMAGKVLLLDLMDNITFSESNPFFVITRQGGGTVSSNFKRFDGTAWIPVNVIVVFRDTTVVNK
jgi:hypothetical protein